MKKAIIVAVILLIGGGGYYLFARNKAQAPTSETNQYQSQLSDNSQQPAAAAPTGQTQAIANTTTPNYTPSTSPTGGEVPPPNIQVVEVDYDGTQFSPAVVNIKVNDWVFFKNKSTLDMWPASNPHPSHTIYPEFDAKKRVAPGEQFKFEFTKAGSWGYHNHLNPDAGGTVNVTK